MNPAKLLDDIVATLSRYAPSVIVHAMLFAWLSARVFSDNVIPDGQTVWASLTNLMDGSLKAVGLKLERWYVLAALIIGYFTAFQGLASFLTRLPILRTVYYTRYDPRFVAYAAERLRKRPNFWDTISTLNDLVDSARREIAETGRPHPYQWMLDRDQNICRYYGALLVALVAALAWAVEGGTLARSVSTVWELVIILLVICVIIRWQRSRYYSELNTQLGFWALREHARREEPETPDPLAGYRRKLVEKQYEIHKAIRRSPAGIIRDLFRPLPGFLRRPVKKRIDLPDAPHGDDWDLFASALLKHGDEAYTPPQALSTDAYRSRFSALLECDGAGLFLMAPRALALAPSVGGGYRFDFAERSHTGYQMPIRLKAGDSLDDSSLRVHSGGEVRTFLVEIGAHPIENLSQRDFPSGNKNWWVLLAPYEEEAVWGPRNTSRDWDFGDFTLSTTVPIVFGSSYLLGLQTRHGTQATIAFQCFKAEEAEKLLVAWRFIALRTPEEEDLQIKSWRHLSAWRDLFRQKENT